MAWPNRREIARRIEAASPDAIHIATEGPIGWAVRAYCRRRKLAFTTSYTTRFPEYIAVRSIIPAWLSYAVLRHFHSAAAMTMVATSSLRQELSAKGFRKLGSWTRGVDTNLFRPDDPVELDLPRPIFMTVGRVAVEKNLEAFLALNLPGSKVVIGDGPQKAELERRYPKVKFLGEKTGNDLTSHLAAADVFVFPSLTDTFGVVQLEALACGTPVAAFPVTGPLDVIADHPIGVLDSGPAPRLHRRAEPVPGSVPQFCAGAFLGKQRKAVHRQSERVAAEPFAATRPPHGRPKRGPRLSSRTSLIGPINKRVGTPMAEIIKLDGTRQLDFDRETVEQAYDRWAPIYDLVFGGVFSKGRRAAIQATNSIGGRVLEVGVGTGISLPQYASHLRIFGTDISEAMLRKAKARVADLRLKNVEGLAVMDAEKLEFPDGSFDVVMAQYVVTAVPNPEVALDEFARVLRPGGELILLSRVSADAGMRRFIEQRLQPVVRQLGLRTEFAWSRYAQWLADARGMELIERRPVPPFGHFSLIRFRKIEPVAAAA